MEAAHITWRPLGQLFVERGLITQDELEEALAEQGETRKRLGAILVSRGLVSGPELTSVLVDQLGMELTKESGYGSGLWDEIRRRHPRRGQTDENANGEAEHEALEPNAVPVAEEERQTSVALVQTPAETPSLNEKKLQESRARERAAEAVAQDEERAELQAAQSAERAELEKSLAEERAARKQASQELEQVRAEAAARTSELRELGRQASDLRDQIAETIAKVAAERRSVDQAPGLEQLVGDLQGQFDAARAKARKAEEESATSAARIRELEARLAAAEAALAIEQAKSADAAAELEHARGEAGVEAKHLRESLERLRAEVDQLDAATAWFEYWSGASEPPTPR